jgi:hypothetical protein
MAQAAERRYSCRLDDEARALHYYSEAHRLWPADLDVISWLGAYHVRNEVRGPSWCRRCAWPGSNEPVPAAEAGC